MSDWRGILAALLIGALGPASAVVAEEAVEMTKGTRMTEIHSIATGIETRARQAILERQAGDAKLAATPAFPADWPQKGGTPRLKLFFYRNEPSPGGMVGFDVWPPSLAVMVSVDGDTVLVDGIEALRPPGEAERQYEAADPVSEADLANATQALVSMLASGDPASEHAATVRPVYAAWLAQNPVIASAIRPGQEAFLDWLEEASP